MQVIEINLLPHRAQRRYRRGWWAVALFMASVVLVSAVLVMVNQHLAARIAHTRAIQRAQAVAFAELQQQLLAHKAKQQQARHNQEKTDVLHQVGHSSEQLARLLRHLGQRVSETTTLQSVWLAGNKLTIKGQSASKQEVIKLLNNLGHAHLTQFNRHGDNACFVIEVYVE